MLLYELLTGSPPFARKELEQKGLLEILRVVREEEPVRPSTKLSTADALPSLSANRSTEPKKLTGLLRNELDWIVMKALEKDRTRRYETANGFAADVLRYLAGEPVHAVPPSAAYRIRKFVKRNKVQVLVASVLLLSLLGGITGMTIGLFEARKQQRLALEAQREEANRAEGERLAKLVAQANEKLAEERLIQVELERKKTEAARIEAQTKEAEAKAVIKFFQDKVFAAARPKGQGGGLGASVTLREALTASLPALDQEFADQPLVEAQLRQSLGTTFYFLAVQDAAHSQFERARAIYTRLRGPEHPDTLTSMNSLANTYRALNLQREALVLHEETLAIRKRVLPPNHPDTLTSMNNLASSYAAQNRLADAHKLYSEVLAIQKQTLPKEDPGLLRTMNNLALNLAQLNRHDEARKLFEETLEIQKRVLPQDHPNTLKCMSNLANCYDDLNRHAEAVQLHEETFRIRKRVFPPDHPDILDSMGNLANSYAAVGRQEEALKLREETVAIMKRSLPKDDRNTLGCMYNLARSYYSLNRDSDALKLLEEVLATQKRIYAPGHPDTLLTQIQLAATLIRLKRGSEAISLIDESITKSQANPAVDPRNLANSIALRFNYYQEQGDTGGSRDTVEMWEKLNRTDPASLIFAARLRSLVAMLQAKSKMADAAKLAQVDADRAMHWLRQAVKAVHKDAAPIKQYAEFDFLRNRDDFKKLLSELEPKAEKK